MLWFLAFTLIAGFATTVFILYYRMVDDMRYAFAEQIWLQNAYHTGIALAGLVLVFIFYTTFKQFELRALHRVLATEHDELSVVRTRLEELTHLFELAMALDIRLPVESMLGIMVRRVVSALKAQQASVMLYNPDSDMLETRAFYGVEGEYASNGKVKMGEGIAGRVALERGGMLLQARSNDPFLKEHYKPHRNITSAMSVPLRVDEVCVGVLNVNRINHPDPFNEHQKDVLRIFAEHIFAEHVASVIQQAEAMEEVGQRAQMLELSNARLEELNRMKDVFLSTASHELKTPLTSVIGYAELLNEHQQKLTEEQRTEFLNRLRGEAGQLLGLIEDILDLTRLETGKIELRRNDLDVNQLAQAAVETTRPLAEKAEITIQEQYDPNIPHMLMDEVKMRQVLVNLVGNAIKFSPAGGEVRLQTYWEEESALIEVSDQGPGVTPTESSQIFSLFAQGKEKSTKGLGIGLHLVKRIVELHGGTVGVRGRAGSGSVFWIRIPRSVPTAESSEAA